MKTSEVLQIVQVAAILIGGSWAIWLFLIRQRLQKAQLYKDMELKAVDVIHMPVDKPKLDQIYSQKADSIASLTIEDTVSLSAYAYGVLNLLEVMFNLQRRKMLPKEVFLTWIAWYWEFSKGVFAANIWTTEAKMHYSNDFTMFMNQLIELRTDGMIKAYGLAKKFRLIGRREFDRWLAAHNRI
jgi:uncharacterized membrane protein (DUF2068 family)